MKNKIIFVIFLLLAVSPLTTLRAEPVLKMKTSPFKMTGMRLVKPLKMKTAPFEMTGMRLVKPLKMKTAPFKMTGVRGPWQTKKVITKVLTMRGLRGYNLNGYSPEYENEEAPKPKNESNFEFGLEEGRDRATEQPGARGAGSGARRGAR